jgi:uncharacterized protein (DUF58 family)
MKKTFLQNLSPLLLRHRAEDVSAGLPSLMAAAEKAVATLHSGEHAQRKTGSGEKFWQFRPYDPGDQPQDIDWRQSAKGDHLYIRQKEQQTAQNILFWVQNDQGMNLHHARALTSKYESGIILSLALAILLTHAGEHVGAMNDPSRTGRSAHAVDKLGMSLCQRPLPLPAGPVLPVSATLPKRTSLVLSGDFMQPPAALDMSLRVLSEQASQGLLVQILDPLEYDLPHHGRAIFRPLDDAGEFPIANVASIRAAYQQRLKDHIETVRKIALRHRYGHVLYVTRDDPRAALSSAWRQMAPRPRLQAGG